MKHKDTIQHLEIDAAQDNLVANKLEFARHLVHGIPAHGIEGEKDPKMLECAMNFFFPLETCKALVWEEEQRIIK